VLVCKRLVCPVYDKLGERYSWQSRYVFAGVAFIPPFVGMYL